MAAHLQCGSLDAGLRLDNETTVHGRLASHAPPACILAFNLLVWCRLSSRLDSCVSQLSFHHMFLHLLKSSVAQLNMSHSSISPLLSVHIIATSSISVLVTLSPFWTDTKRKITAGANTRQFLYTLLQVLRDHISPGSGRSRLAYQRQPGHGHPQQGQQQQQQPCGRHRLACHYLLCQLECGAGAARRRLVSEPGPTKAGK